MTRTPTAVLISGRGSNMMSLVEAAERPDYPARIVAVIANRPDAAGLAWARARGVAVKAIDHKAFSSRPEFERSLGAALAETGAELVCLAGFMRLLTAPFVESWSGRMLNIHPSLLPSFKGLRTQEQALAAGVRIAGCTVHFVVPEMDAGPIIAQAAVAVAPDDDADSLATRILAAEHRLYPHALALVAGGKVAMRDGRAVLGSHGCNAGCLISPALPS